MYKYVVSMVNLILVSCMWGIKIIPYSINLVLMVSNIWCDILNLKKSTTGILDGLINLTWVLYVPFQREFTMHATVSKT